MGAVEDIIAERRRQITEEGWSTEHDDGHRDGQLAKAAACYAYLAAVPDTTREVYSLGRKDEIVVIRRMWPWHWDWWKPKDRRRDLVRAGALVVAEIERIDRLAGLSPQYAVAADAPERLAEIERSGGFKD